MRLLLTNKFWQSLISMFLRLTWSGWVLVVDYHSNVKIMYKLMNTCWTILRNGELRWTIWQILCLLVTVMAAILLALTLLSILSIFRNLYCSLPLELKYLRRVGNLNWWDSELAKDHLGGQHLWKSICGADFLRLI